MFKMGGVLVSILVLMVMLSFINANSKDSICEGLVAAEDDECGLAGVWRNQLGSHMNFTCSDGQISGWYMTAVGRAEGYYVMSRRYLMGPANSTILGWVVAYENDYGNSNSVASWSGIHYTSDDIIRTQWLLTRYQLPKDYWSCTMINHDEFRRACKHLHQQTSTFL